MTSAADVIAVAQREVGLVERPVNLSKFGAWYGMDGQLWCAMFVSWCFNQAGASHLVAASTKKGFSLCAAGAAWFQKRGQWGTQPRVGAVAFYRFKKGPPRINHVGIVIGINGNGSIDTIEGNTSRGTGSSQRDGGGVWRRRRAVDIVGYGYPAYDGGSGPLPPPPPPPPGNEVERIRQIQGLVGTAADGEWGPKTAAACNQHFVGWQAEVQRRGGKTKMENRKDIVEWLQHQGNRKGFPLLVDGDAGPATSHFIVNGLGQKDAICGANGFRAACT